MTSLDYREKQYTWAEQEYRAGEIIGLVAVYDNIPSALRRQIDELVSEGYSKKLFIGSLYEASLLLLKSGRFSDFDLLREQAQQMYSKYCCAVEMQRARTYVERRKSENIAVLVLRSGKIITTMTLFPFKNAESIPSLEYLNLGTILREIPNAPGLEVGRLVKATSKDGNCKTDGRNLLCAASIASAFIVARDFATKNGLLSDKKSFICGDTYGAFMKTLQRFFPLRPFPSSINPSILEETSDSRDVAVYFLQRHVLGSFESVGDLTSAINTIKSGDPQIADRIVALLKSGLDQMGVQSFDRFNPKNFRVDFFYFPFHHPETQEGFTRLHNIIKRSIRGHSISLN